MGAGISVLRAAEHVPLLDRTYILISGAMRYVSVAPQLQAASTAGLVSYSYRTFQEFSPREDSFGHSSRYFGLRRDGFRPGRASQNRYYQHPGRNRRHP